jgi:hypothetical protein
VLLFQNKQQGFFKFSMVCPFFFRRYLNAFQISSGVSDHSDFARRRCGLNECMPMENSASLSLISPNLLQSEGVEVHQLSEEGSPQPEFTQGSKKRKGPKKQIRKIVDPNKDKATVDPCKYKTKLCRSWARDGLPASSQQLEILQLSFELQAIAHMRAFAAMLMGSKTSDQCSKTPKFCNR